MEDLAKINRTPDYPHGRSVKWPKVYRGLRRRGFSKEGAARISNAMSNKYRGGSRQPLSATAGRKPIPEDILDKRPDLRKHASHDGIDEVPVVYVDRRGNRVAEVVKHMGPGDHPGGTPQSTHGSGKYGTSGSKMVERLSPGGDFSEGFTITPITGTPPAGGFVVAIPGHELRVPAAEMTPETVARHRRESWSAFADIPGAMWGGWYDSVNQEFVLDVSVVVGDITTAEKMGREFGQDAIFDLTNFVEVRTDDDGTSVRQWREQFERVPIAARDLSLGDIGGRLAPMSKHASHNQEDHGNWADGQKTCTNQVERRSGGGVSTGAGDRSGKYRGTCGRPAAEGSAFCAKCQNQMNKESDQSHYRWHKQPWNQTGACPRGADCDLVAKHAAPIHPGTGSDQFVHGGDTGIDQSHLQEDPRVHAYVSGAGRFTLPPLDPNHYWIRSGRKEDVEKKIGKLSRRAAKYFGKEDPIKVSWTGRKHQEPVYAMDTIDPDGGFLYINGEKVLSHHETWIEARIDGEPPVLANHRILARIEHVKNEDGDYTNIVSRAPGTEGTEIPTFYRNSGPACDVCKRNIHRNDTFLVESLESGKINQVGRDDLRAFTGADNAEDLAKYASVWSEIGGALDDDEFSGGGGTDILPAKQFMAYAAAEIRENGYRKTDSDLSTKETAISRMRYAQKDRSYLATEADWVKAEEAMEYYQSLDPETLDEFEYSLRASVLNPNGVGRNTGRVAYAVEHVQRVKQRESYEQAKAKQRAIETADVPDYPTGKQTGLTGTIVSHKWQGDQYSRYGPSHKMLVRLDDGNKVWSTVPSSIDHLATGGGGRIPSDRNVRGELAGMRIRFNATLERSSDDDHFGFASKPTARKADLEWIYATNGVVPDPENEGYYLWPESQSEREPVGSSV